MLRRRHLRVLGFLGAVWLGGSVAMAAPERETLPALHIDPAGITVSGISSGAFMAVQLHVALSRTFSGAASIAGGIYWCAEGSQMRALMQCLHMPDQIDSQRDVDQARKDAQAGRIDPVENLKTSHVYIYASPSDSVVAPGESAKLKEFYERLAPGAAIKYETNIDTAHGFPTQSYGGDCHVAANPWILNCGFDAAGELLKQLYGPLQSPTPATVKNLSQFSQSAYASQDALMDPEGAVYVPSRCRDGKTCRLHVALHGCDMNFEAIQDQFVRNAGYNEWAEANDIVILYPQAAKSMTANPQGCWDWFGATGPDYALKSGKQIHAIAQMITRLSSGGH